MTRLSAKKGKENSEKNPLLSETSKNGDDGSYESNSDKSGSEDSEQSENSNENEESSQSTIEQVYDFAEIDYSDVKHFCNQCQQRYLEFTSNVCQNDFWMLWETFMGTFDFCLDIAVVIK